MMICPLKKLIFVLFNGFKVKRFLSKKRTIILIQSLFKNSKKKLSATIFYVAIRKMLIVKIAI